ncbi:alanine racemase [Sulfuricurvum sp.]|uniref:alanine racemase n=1 Tax=Sulfuricurvum sp. TaxID=2025608 RepID=UPI003BB6D4E3
MASIKLSREALIHNLDIIAHQVGGKNKIAVVLKDNAYGHGAVMIAEAASQYGIREAVVRLEREADEIAEYFDNVLILGDMPTLPKANYSYVINSLDSIEMFSEGSRVELKVDTGMHRNGVAINELEVAFTRMNEKGLTCVGVMSHLRASDTLSSEWFWQRRNFDEVKIKASLLAKKYGWEPRFHLSNSAGIFRSAVCKDDMVRVGIVLYGCLEMEKTLPQPEVKPVLSLWGERIATRILKKGERVGYNGIYEAQNDEVISTYDLGYANGLDRLASNCFVTPEGIALRGRISMDNAAFASDKEELLIFNDANHYARSVGTIGYEILACLDKDLKREWID